MFQENEKNSHAPSFLTPEAVLMFTIAGFLDVAGLLCFLLDFVGGIGNFLSFIFDIGGIIIIGGWLLVRSGVIISPKRGLKQLAKKSFGSAGLGIAGELLPFAGDLLPFWTWIVYSELKKE